MLTKFRQQYVTDLAYVHTISFRVVKSIRGAPKEYDLDDGRLRSLEKILLTLEGKLMEGKILRVS